MASFSLSSGVALVYPTRSAFGRVWSKPAVLDSGQSNQARERGSEMSLGDLTAAAAGGDQGAFDALHRRVGAGLRRWLLKRTGGKAELVDDLTQTTWTAVWQAMRTGRYDPKRSAITTFVYAVGNNAWLTHLRRDSRGRGSEAADAVAGAGREPVAHEPVDDVMAEAEAAEMVRACLRDGAVAGLSDQERFIIREIAAGESDRGLARRLGLSCSTVNVKKHSGLAKIRVYLESRGAGREGRSEAGSIARKGSAGGVGVVGGAGGVRTGPASEGTSGVPDSSAGLAGGVS